MNRIAKMLAVPVLLLGLHGLSSADENSRRAFELAINQYKSTAVRITALPTMMYGTGVAVSVERDGENQFILITNKHVIAGAEALRLSFPITNDSAQYNTWTFHVNLYSPSDSALYDVHDDSLDIATIAFDFPPIGHSDKGYRPTVIKWSSFSSPADLFAGEEILFVGYPLGLAANGVEPLVRTGIISGIDSLNNRIYLDAQSFGGSSGSPVYLKPPALTKAPNFIGIIAGHVHYVKELKNLQTNQIEMIQTENSGLAIVMPAWEIKKLLDSQY